MSSTSFTNRIDYFDILRAIAIIGVIFIHVSAGYLDTTSNVTNLGLLSYLVFNKLSRFCVPVFFMISGALFLDNNRELSVKKIFTKYIKRIAIAFFTFSFIYSLIGYFTTDVNERSFHTLVANFLVGHYHMWFLFAIVGLYVLTPILRVIVKNKEAMVYFLVVSGVILSVLPAIISSLPSSGTSIINNMTNDFALNFPKWSFYYVLGYALHTYRSNVSKGILAATLIIGALLILSVGFFLVKDDAYKYICWDYNSPLIICLSSALFLLFKKVSWASTKFVKLVSECSFGIYLVHDIFVKCLKNNILNLNVQGGGIFANHHRFCIQFPINYVV